MRDDHFDLIKHSGMTRTLTVLGATGSIGQQTLDVVRRYPEEFDVLALTASRGSDVLASYVLSSILLMQWLEVNRNLINFGAG